MKRGDCTGRAFFLVSLLLVFTPPLCGFDLQDRDLSVRPGDDFYRYALGAWDARTVIAPDQAEAGVDSEVTERVRVQLRDIIEHSNPAAKSDEGLIGALYASFMDEAGVEALDDAPLKEDIAAIADARRKDQIVALMAKSYLGFGASFFSLTVAPDAKLPQNALIVGQGGLGMPDRDYYLEAESRVQKDAYQAYISRALRMIGRSQAAEAARAVVELESRIAAVSWSQVQSRDVNALYNPMSVTELVAYAPGFPWRSFLERAAAAHVDRVVVAEKTAVRDLSRLFATTPLETLKAWEMFHTVDAASAYLSNRFVASRFAFRSSALMGITQMRPRWNRGVALINGSLGPVLGRAYAKRHFPAQAKAQMLELVGQLKSAMKARINASPWMSAATKAEALNKLERMQVFVGYPDVWRDYSALQLHAGDLYGNVVRSMALDWHDQVAKVGKPVNPLEWGPFDWGIQPQTVDAFNIAAENKIIFPAAILQPPFFELNADPASNYGAIGGIIGHEITHGFDDQGRKIDASGALRDWWTAADAARFSAEAQKLVAQFDAFEPLPGMHINGHQVLGENIADLGGLLLALDAYHASLNGRQPPRISGLSGDQRVFLGWASRWRRKQRDDALRQQIAMNTHAPAAFRVSGPVRNIDLWYYAFDVRPGDKLYLQPADRARIW
jgi:putative endopeptidase